MLIFENIFVTIHILNANIKFYLDTILEISLNYSKFYYSTFTTLIAQKSKLKKLT